MNECRFHRNAFERVRMLRRTLSPLKFVSKSCSWKSDFISMKSREEKCGLDGWMDGWRLEGWPESNWGVRIPFSTLENVVQFFRNGPDYAVLFIQRTTSKLASASWASHPNRSMEPRSSRSISEHFLVKDTASLHRQPRVH